jgi:hypothetical protein
MGFVIIIPFYVQGKWEEKDGLKEDVSASDQGAHSMFNKSLGICGI